MDKDIRNKLQRATQAARALIEDEYGEQLEGTFDLRLDGTIPSEPGEHLDAHHQVLWSKLIAAIGHLEAGGEKKLEAVQAYLREAAFTTLNRFVALKMLEARGLVLESVSQGDQSSGFKEFTGLAPGLVQLPDNGYRLYIESLFDEIGREVRVLFDRRDPASLLWPRRQALQDLLEILNAPELASVWIEDETIGWVYQYFNGEDERRAMRDASQAPRNSRELAVRNQFFTPRYVVQFLVDNTLGRTWFEMMQGETRLKGLDYLVRRQHEVFLDEGQAVPEEPEGVNFGETPEHPFPVLFRAKKDPRDLRILDPACGSGHFLLYTFDLLLTIYEEAWQDEGAAASQLTGATLRADYRELEALRIAAPELVLRHNLHGIDIDPRAAQIAALALWLRAQKAFQLSELPRSQRPEITKTKIAIAEPMPGEADLREAFVATLEPKLGKLVERVFDRMSLAGEAGYLLRIAEMMEESIRQIYGGAADMFSKQDEDRWVKAAKDLSTSLATFATSAAANQAFTRQLFAGDAARGLGFIEVCSQRYDTILMNPPFGQCTPESFEYLRNSYQGAHSDIYAGFIERAAELAPDGRIGAITSRSFLVAPRLERLRRLTVIPQLEFLADLGLGVMDNAFVEAAASVLDAGCPESFVAWDCRHGRAFDPHTFEGIQSSPVPASIYKSRITRLPQLKILYSMPFEVVEAFEDLPPFEPTAGTAREGMKSFDNERFIRASWEAPSSEIGANRTWSWFVKGGEKAFYYSTPHLLLNWKEEGAELRAVNLQLNGSTSQVRQASRYWRRAGATYSKRSSKGFSARALPMGCIFSSNGPAILSESDLDDYALLGWLNSKPIRALIHLQSNAADYSTGSLKRLPWPAGLQPAPADATIALREALNALMRRASGDEIDQLFSGFQHTEQPRKGASSTTDGEALRHAMAMWDELVAAAYGFRSARWADDLLAEDFDEQEVGEEPIDSRDSSLEEGPAFEAILNAVSFAAGVACGRFDIRLATGECPPPLKSDPFDLLPSCAPAMLTGNDGLPLDAPLTGYPIDYPIDGILVDDDGAKSDLVTAVRATFEQMFSDPATRWVEAAETLDNRDRTLRGWFAREFFELHIKRYSKSGRKAPIYWQLATPSASYSAWLYYHRLSRDTLFRLLNDHAVPKLRHEERKLTELSQDAGPNPTASQRKEIDAQETFVSELRAFRDEVERVAPLWNPNLNDGVILNFAPLWRLVPQHKAWQKECKSAWDKLCKGDYDWAHLAMHLWPERVVPKCANDRSIAIAHGLEEAFWREDEDGKWQRKTVSDEEVEALVAERTSPAVKASLKSLLEAPTPLAGRGRAPRRKKATTRRAKAAAPSDASVASREQTPRRSNSTRILDASALDQIRSAIATLGGNAAKSDILESTGLSASQWTPAINALLAEGSVTKTGQKRGTRYHLAQDHD